MSGKRILKMSSGNMIFIGSVTLKPMFREVKSL